MSKPIRSQEYVSKRTGRFVEVMKIYKDHNRVTFFDNRPCHLDKFHLKYKLAKPALGLSGTTKRERNNKI